MGGCAELGRPRRVNLACKGLVCSAGSRGGFDLGEKRCGVVVGFFSIGHIHTRPAGGGPGVLGNAPHKNTPPTNLGSQICSKEKKQKSFQTRVTEYKAAAAVLCYTDLQAIPQNSS